MVRECSDRSLYRTSQFSEGGQAEPEEPNEEAMIGLVERIFQKEGIKCTNREAKTMFNLVGSLGADFKSDGPVNDGLCFKVEEKGLKLHTEAGVEELSQKLRGQALTSHGSTSGWNVCGLTEEIRGTRKGSKGRVQEKNRKGKEGIAFMPRRLQTPSIRRALLSSRVPKRNEVLGTRSVPIFERRVLHRRRTNVCVCVVS